ncbi:MAG: oxygen-independent coproporphyrinogen III oxidase [Balneolaceae bacterium]
MNTDQLAQLARTYNVAGPRYTSYPTALHLQEVEHPSDANELLALRYESPGAYSLYIHIPFCFSLCWYCGCTKVITKDQDRGDHYLDYLEKEIALTSNYLHRNHSVHQIHLGGGTPTFLSPPQLRRLFSILHTHLNIAPGAECSAEIDPRTCTADHVLALADVGCNRASLGVQDTNPEVQEAIHRIQPFEQTVRVTEQLRKAGIDEINFDLIYGLPLQTPDTFSKTLADAISLKPGRFAVYSYAHLPGVMPAQRLLNEADMPTGSKKLDLLLMAVDTLPKHGYRFIGMDHFALDDDPLTVAMENGTMHRNFMGYTTQSGLETIALGMSGISQHDRYMLQNHKDLQQYYDHLDSGSLPVAKQLTLSDDDRVRRDIIMQIMCSQTVSFDAISTPDGSSFRSYFNDELMALTPLQEDGLVELSGDGLSATETGRYFLRNIAMAFDASLHSKRAAASYSATV